MNKPIILRLLLLSTLLLSTRGYAAAISEEQIHINADHMKANIETGHSVYTGNVKVRQGKLYLTGDKIVVVQKKNEVELITVTGKPAHYYHVTEKEQVIKANSEKMVYTASKNQLIMTINAKLDHPEHTISSQKIVYNTLTKVAIAGDRRTPVKPGENERVKITLTPKSQDKTDSPDEGATNQESSR